MFDGVPFQVDGVVQVSCRQRADVEGSNQPPRLTAEIPVGVGGELLHLLAAVEGSVPESNVVARLKLDYAGGSNAVVLLRFGDQVRNWTAPWHKSERALRDTNCTVAWTGVNADTV